MTWTWDEKETEFAGGQAVMLWRAYAETLVEAIEHWLGELERIRP